jgi:hypothetical protein
LFQALFVLGSEVDDGSGPRHERQYTS